MQVLPLVGLLQRRREAWVSRHGVGAVQRRGVSLLDVGRMHARRSRVRQLVALREVRILHGQLRSLLQMNRVRLVQARHLPRAHQLGVQHLRSAGSAAAVLLHRRSTRRLSGVRVSRRVL